MSGAPPQSPYQIGTVPNPFTTSPEEFMQGMQGFANAHGAPQQQGPPSVQMPQQNPVDMGHFSIPYPDGGPTAGGGQVPPQQAPQGPQAPFGYRDVTDLVNARNAAAQAYATQSGQAPPALPQMVGPHVNPILGALLAAANFAANRENPRLIGANAPGTAAAHSEMGVFQNQADLANQNAMGGYQSQIAARQAGLAQSGLQAQNSEQQLKDVMGTNAAIMAQQAALAEKVAPANIRYEQGLGVAGINAGARMYGADQSVKRAQISADERLKLGTYISDQASKDKTLGQIVLQLNNPNTPDTIKPALYQQLQQTRPDIYGAMTPEEIADTNKLTPEQTAKLAQATMFNAHAQAFASVPGLNQAKANNLAMLTSQIPDLDASKIALNYGNLANLESLGADRVNRTNILADAGQRQIYGQQITGIRDNLTGLSGQINQIRRTNAQLTASMELASTADKPGILAQIAANNAKIDGTADATGQHQMGLQDMYNELSQRSKAVQNQIGQVGQNGQVNVPRGTSAPPGPAWTPTNGVLPTTPAQLSAWKALRDQAWVENRGNVRTDVQKRAAFLQTYKQLGITPPAG